MAAWKKELKRHGRYKNRKPTPFISFDTSPKAIEALANKQNNPRRKQWLTVINPAIRMKKGLPILNVDTARNYFTSQNCRSSSKSRKSNFICLWEVTCEEIVETWSWDDLCEDEDWYNNIVLPNFRVHQFERSEKYEAHYRDSEWYFSIAQSAKRWSKSMRSEEYEAIQNYREAIILGPRQSRCYEMVEFRDLSSSLLKTLGNLYFELKPEERIIELKDLLDRLVSILLKLQNGISLGTPPGAATKISKENPGDSPELVRRRRLQARLAADDNTDYLDMLEGFLELFADKTHEDVENSKYKNDNRTGFATLEDRNIYTAELENHLMEETKSEEYPGMRNLNEKPEDDSTDEDWVISSSKEVWNLHLKDETN
ncbi:hypothetical protein N7456_005521 [Penicillium angulare]|uniref:DUF7587 domain-containing protein n=1 Tax=Penicillium angulare TaxID=116970 RepID=A0A9W9FYP1_9EURO|nr:hypothetical protein N7456_005521 [Penicillium angulare]